MNYIVLVKSFMLPINLNRIVDTVAGREDLKSKEDLTPKYILEQLELLLKNEKTTILCMSNAEKANPKSFKVRDENSHKIVLRAAFYDSLSPKRLILDLNLNKKQFDTIISEISYNFNKNIIEPGEMAGIIAAQSNGEPLEIIYFVSGTGSSGCVNILY
jgi:hypothetical protein